MSKKKSIYLDYQASTPISQNVLDIMRSAEDVGYANPHSSDHSLGWESARIIDEAASEIAALIGALENEIVFVSGATEANNLAIIGVGLSARNKTTRSKIIVSEIDHKCSLEAARFMEENFGYEFVKASVNSDGIVDVDNLKNIIDTNTLLVSVMAVNNEIGTNQPIREISNICREAGVIFHVDAAQSLYRDIDVVEDGIDLLSLSSHKLYGPKGIGALYINDLISIKPSPLLQGGGQQQGYRSGTVPTSLTAGFGAAIAELKGFQKEEIQILTQYQKYIWDKLKGSIEDCYINGSTKDRHPGNLNITFPNVDAKWLVGNLQPNIAISTGSACTSGIPEPSHVLRAIGLSTKNAECSVRISLGRRTTREEVDTAADMIIDAVKYYREEFR